MIDLVKFIFLLVKYIFNVKFNFFEYFVYFFEVPNCANLQEFHLSKIFFLKGINPRFDSQ